VRIKLAFGRSIACASGFSRGKKVHLFKIGLFSCVEETYVSLKRKHSMLEGGESPTLFPCDS
jgi:hypothetical protein